MLLMLCSCSPTKQGSLSFKQFINALKELGVQVEKHQGRTLGTERKGAAPSSSAANKSEGGPARLAAASEQTTTQAQHFEEAAESSKALNKSTSADGAAMGKIDPFPAIAPPEEENGITQGLLLKKQPEEVDFAHFHQEPPIRPESQKKADELEARSLENADLQYVVQSFIKLQNDQPQHYRLGYLRKLILQAIEEFKRKQVLDKVQIGKESQPFPFFLMHFVNVFWYPCYPSGAFSKFFIFVCVLHLLLFVRVLFCSSTLLIVVVSARF